MIFKDKKRETIVFGKDFDIVKLDDEYWYESNNNDDEIFELALLAREPSGIKSFRKKLRLSRYADVVGIEDSSGDYLFFVKIETFTFRTEKALTAAIALQRQVGKTRVRTLRNDSRHSDILITNPIPPSETELKGISRFFDDLDMDEIDEFMYSLLKTMRECDKYKYVTRIQHTTRYGKSYWVYTFFNNHELAKKFLNQHQQEEIIVEA